MTSATRTIGHVTLYEGTNGRWVSASYSRPDDFDRLLADDIDSAEYVRRLRQRTRDEREADRLMGTRAR
jgi:DNA transposition AAA+ family ATPase